jgi:hypothetical protein
MPPLFRKRCFVPARLLTRFASKQRKQLQFFQKFSLLRTVRA